MDVVFFPGSVVKNEMKLFLMLVWMTNPPRASAGFAAAKFATQRNAHSWTVTKALFWIMTPGLSTKEVVSPVPAGTTKPTFSSVTPTEESIKIAAVDTLGATWGFQISHVAPCPVMVNGTCTPTILIV